MKVETIELPKKYHGAVEHWRRHTFKDYELLMDDWEKYFPTDEKFCLCAKMEVGTPDVIQKHPKVLAAYLGEETEDDEAEAS